MSTTPTPTPLDPALESVVDQTLDLVSGRPEGGQADPRMSADVVGLSEAGEPVISVINLDTREHWHLIVRPIPWRD